MRNRADHLHLSRQIALLGVIITCAVMIVMLPLYGSLSDRFGRRRLFGWGAAGIGLLAFPSFWLMDTQATPLVWLAIIISFGLVYPTVYGPRAELFSELFDTRVRYSGISFVYQFSGIFASGLTPIVATALLAAGGNRPWLICVCSGRQPGERDLGLCDEGDREARYIDRRSARSADGRSRLS